MTASRMSGGDVKTETSTFVEPVKFSRRTCTVSPGEKAISARMEMVTLEIFPARPGLYDNAVESVNEPTGWVERIEVGKTGPSRAFEPIVTVA